MIAKISRLSLAIYSGIITFFLLVSTLILYLYSDDERHWFSELFHAKVFRIPLVIHLLAISLAIGCIVYILVTVIQKSQFRRLEEKLRLLANGNYDNSLLKKELPRAKQDESMMLIEHDITAIQTKMTDMSRELQQLNSRPQLVEGETKEAILEEERHRLARELHDSVSQQLFAAMMMLSALNEQAQKSDQSEMQKKQLGMVADIINAAQSEMRALLLHLRPINLENKSLRQGIEQLLKELQTKIQIKLKWDVEDVHLDPSIEDQLFRVVQELLSNTLRHAKAEELEVYLHKVGNNVLLRFVDDGLGFDSSEMKAGSYGLRNIRERIAGIGGTVKIISFKGQGTSVEIKVPLVGEDVADD